MHLPKTLRRKCGIDEVGRGPLAGPVTAAAVVLPETFDTSILADSKVLSEPRRHAIEELLIAEGTHVGYGWVEPADIDRMNIHNASLLAMRLAFDSLLANWSKDSPTGGENSDIILDVIVDGRFSPDIPASCHAVVGADRIVPEVMAASILAKNARDRRMVAFAEKYGVYGFERHKGYPTAKHKQALRLHGPCPIHRRSFRGVLTVPLEDN